MAEAWTSPHAAGATTAAEPAVRRITIADVGDALRRGWQDFLAAPTQLVFLGLIYPLVGLFAGWAAAGRDTMALFYPLVAGLSLMGIGCVMLTGVEPGGSYGGVLPAFVVFGAGLGLSFVSQTITATAGVDPGAQGLASGLLNTAQQLGFAVGVAALVSVAVSASEGSGAASMAQRLVDGYSAGYLASAGVALAGVVAALLLVPRVRPAPEVAA